MPRLKGRRLGEAIPLGCLLETLCLHQSISALSLICWNIGSGQEFVLGPASPKDDPTPSHTYSSLHPRPATRENGRTQAPI